MSDQLTGKTLGRYQLKCLIGEGGMGVVFRAFDPNLQREVAIKVMHPHLMRKPGFKDRFLQEAVVAARLKHPGIVHVYDSGEANGVLYIVMAFIPGGNLEEMLDELKTKGERMLLPEAVEIIQQVSQALDYAHRHGVLHRDIKPGNIMLEPEPCGGLPFRPVLTDLGLAKLLEGGVETQTGTSMGTPAYMSPEQAQGLPVDVRSDVYSLGALLFHLCVGQPPFPAKTITEALRYHVQEPPPLPRQANPLISRELDAIILKALEKDPAKRFADSAQFANVLGRALTTLPTRQGFASSAGGATTTVSASTALDAVGGRSLATLLEQSIVRQRGPSVLDEFPRAVPQAGLDQIQVIEPDHTARTVTANTQVITVGRTPDNQIVLDDPKVSRHHLRIEVSGSVYIVTDQGSSNGSFLGGVKLLKGVAQEWDPAQPLKAGDTYLKLVRARESVGTQVDSGPIPSRPGSQVRPSSPGVRFSVTLDRTQLPVDPGANAALSVQILNQGSQVDHYRVTVEGAPAGWIRSLPEQPIRCMPGEEQRVMLSFQPPRSPQSKAGRCMLSILVTCEEDHTQIIRSSCALTIAPYHQFTGEMHPERLRAGSAGQVQVTNQGNTPETFHLTWNDPASDLVFEPPQVKIKVEPGQQAEVGFRTQMRRRRWSGGDQFHRFTTTIRSLQAGTEVQPQGLPGEVISRGSFPAWLLPLLIGVCLFLSMAAYALYKDWQDRQTSAAQSAALAAQAQAATANEAARLMTSQAQQVNMTSTAQQQTANERVTATWIAATLTAANLSASQTAASQAEAAKQGTESVVQARHAAETEDARKKTEDASAAAATQTEATRQTAEARQAEIDRQTQEAFQKTQTVIQTLNALPSGTVPFFSLENPNSLNPNFNWHLGTNPASSYSINANDNSINMTAGTNTMNWGLDDTAPMVLYRVSGNFDAQVEGWCTPPNTNEHQGFGLGIRSRAVHSNWLQMTLDQALNLYLTQDDSKATYHLQSIPYGGGHIYLRIIRIGNSYTMAYGSDGNNWSNIITDYNFDAIPSDAEIFTFVSSSTPSLFYSAVFRNFRLFNR
jgi:eukaryotic-like serine/threonine-protein kinase